nr:hypothetical protein CFP56_13230 [Quercus suber]
MAQGSRMFLPVMLNRRAIALSSWVDECELFCISSDRTPTKVELHAECQSPPRQSNIHKLDVFGNKGTPMSATPLTIRPATLAASDHELYIDLKDSQIEWLSSVGSTAQWGTELSRKANPAITEKTRGWVERSERQAPWGRDWVRAFVAESSASPGTAVAGLVLEAKAAAYTRAVLPEQDDSDPFVYLTYLLSNRHAGPERKGAGAALIEFAKEQTRSVGLQRLCLDCWNGNDRKLVNYYESQGFKPLGDFVAPGDDKWPGCVMEMRL